MENENSNNVEQKKEVVFDGYVVDEHGEEMAQFTGDFGF